MKISLLEFVDYVDLFNKNVLYGTRVCNDRFIDIVLPYTFIECIFNQNKMRYMTSLTVCVKRYTLQYSTTEPLHLYYNWLHPIFFAIIRKPIETFGSEGSKRKQKRNTKGFKVATWLKPTRVPIDWDPIRFPVPSTRKNKNKKGTMGTVPWVGFWKNQKEGIEFTSFAKKFLFQF